MTKIKLEEKLLGEHWSLKIIGITAILVILSSYYLPSSLGILPILLLAIIGIYTIIRE